MTQTKVEAPFVQNNAHFKNLIINGDMQIAQRATAATTIGSAFHMNTIDRWYGMESTDGTATLERHDMSAAEKVTTGQHYALEWNCTGADGTIGASQYAGAAYYVEAQHLYPLLYGTSSAKTFTLSFWVKSNTTGTYSIGLAKNDSTVYYYGATYAISSADTWEYKTIVITPTAGSTSLITGANGIINNDNGIGLQFFFYTALGSTWHGTANQWSSSAIYGTSDQPNLMASTSNNWYIAGVQLEVGDAASDFEYLPVDVQLQRCKRYYVKLTGSYAQFGQIYNGHYNGTNQFQGAYTYPVQMRAAPTLSHTTTSSNNASSAYAIATTGSIDYIDSLLLYNANDRTTLLYTGSGQASNDTGMGGNMYVQSAISELALVAEL